MEDDLDPQNTVAQLRACTNLATVKKALQTADEEWTERFIEAGGLVAILDCLSVLGEREVDTLSDAMPRLDVVSCLKAVLNCRYGLEWVIRRGVGGVGGGEEAGGGREGSQVGRIALALNTDNMLLKIQIFLVLSAIAKHSKEGLEATLTALDLYKTKFCLRHRYSVLVQELSQSAAFPECQATVMVFVNYLLSSCQDLEARMRLRSELNALDFSDILAIIRYTDNEALKRQVKVYEESLLKDREEAAMPGGVDITDHQQLFTALFEKVFGTPNSTKLLSILQKMLLIDRDTPIGDIIWNSLETMSDSALNIYSEQQAQRVGTSEMVALRRALEAEAARKASLQKEKEEEKQEGGKPGPPPPAPAPPPPAPCPPPAPPGPGPDLGSGVGKVPKPPPIGPDSDHNTPDTSVAEIISIFEKAFHYTPTKPMKKVNWDKALAYEAKKPCAVWHRASGEEFLITFGESSITGIETLFCQKWDTTDSSDDKEGKDKSKPKPQKTINLYLPNQKKALNVNLVLNAIKKPDPENKDKKILVTTKDVLDIIRGGDVSKMTLTQANILLEWAPEQSDMVFLEPFMKDPKLYEKLGVVEKYMVGLLRMPDFAHRLRVLRNKMIFADMHNEYQPTFDLLHVAMDELMKSTSLKDLLHIILLTGNFINGNTQLGKAYGFKISSLMKLSNTLANVRRTTLNVNFLHFLVTVCERDCPRLIKFQSELPHLDDASRISVDETEKELEGWKKEVDELKELVTQAKDLQLGEDFVSQLKEFLPEAEKTLTGLLEELEKVKLKGQKLAQYFCDSRAEFLEFVFLEIKNFSLQFSKCIKETDQENPIITFLNPSGGIASDGGGIASDGKESPSPEQLTTPPPRPGLSRATSLVTANILEIPDSLTTIAEEHLPAEEHLSASQENGFIKDDGGSPPIAMKTPHAANIVVTDVDEKDQTQRGYKQGRLHSLLHKGRSITSIARPTLSPMSRQSSWKEYKYHYPRHMVPRGGSWMGSEYDRMPSSTGVQNTIFDGNFEEVAKLLLKMADAIEREI